MSDADEMIPPTALVGCVCGLPPFTGLENFHYYALVASDEAERPKQISDAQNSGILIWLSTIVLLPVHLELELCRKAQYSAGFWALGLMLFVPVQRLTETSKNAGLHTNGIVVGTAPIL